MEMLLAVIWWVLWLHEFAEERRAVISLRGSTKSRTIRGFLVGLNSVPARRRIG
jgi:hypothetical protein